MKKFISVTITLIILCVFFLVGAPYVFADKFSDWQMAPDGEYLKHEGKKYYPVKESASFDFDYSKYNHDANNSDYATVRLYFDDKTMEKYYRYSNVLIPTGVDCPCVQVRFSSDYSTTFYVYAEKSELKKYEDLARGIGSSYSVKTWEYYSSSFEISAEDFDEWLSGETVTTKLIHLNKYKKTELYAVDGTGLVNIESGMIYIDADTEDVYLLRYNDSEETAYLANGIVNDHINTEVTLYKLEDEELYQDFITYYNTEPKDDLEWIEPEKSDITFLKVFCVFLFGVLPMLLTAFSIVMLCVIKDKKYYRAYIMMLIGSVLVLIVCISLIILFL
ncbi:MAG: hypothetical protein IJD93_01090 [Ruminococcus sp.]|nr:hypothetical protein [Ruminococcus sp.]